MNRFFSYTIFRAMATIAAILAVIVSAQAQGVLQRARQAVESSMKRYRPFVSLWAAFVLLFLLSSLQQVKAQELRNSSNTVIGKIESGGVVRDKANRQVGRIDFDGAIRNSSNAQIGKLESDGVVRDKSNAPVGKVESDGVVRDKSNAQIGKIQSDGTVLGRNNARIGTATGVKKEWAAVAFFFFFDLT